MFALADYPQAILTGFTHAPVRNRRAFGGNYAPFIALSFFLSCMRRTLETITPFCQPMHGLRPFSPSPFTIRSHAQQAANVQHDSPSDTNGKAFLCQPGKALVRASPANAEQSPKIGRPDNTPALPAEDCQLFQSQQIGGRKPPLAQFAQIAGYKPDHLPLDGLALTPFRFAHLHFIAPTLERTCRKREPGLHLGLYRAAF